MDIVKSFKSWFTQNSDGTKTLCTESVLVDAAVSHFVLEHISREIVKKVAYDFLESNKENLEREILNNPKFADAVYNAIVLKKAQEVINPRRD